jgi:hypothetical protein
MNLLLDDGTQLNDAGIFEVCEWWIETYPEDIFVNEPKEVVEIRELMKTILSKQKVINYGNKNNP